MTSLQPTKMKPPHHDALLLCLAIAGCAAPEQTVTVLAASSLQRPYNELESAFELENPGVNARLSFAGSQTLATQIRHGIGADVYTSADEHHMGSLRSEGWVSGSTVVACNALVLATSSPVALELAELDRVGSLIVGTPQVPLGRYTDTLLDAAQATHGAAWRRRVRSVVVSRERNASLVANKIAMGEADAAIVYATDAKALGLTSTPLPANLAPTPCYHQALVQPASPNGLGARWIRFVTGPTGDQTLRRHGFDPATR